MPYVMSQLMFSLAETILFSAIMGISIYLSLPILLLKKTGEATTKLLNAVAIGIMIFLMGDVFSNVTPSLYNGGLYGYGSSPYLDSIFAASLAAGFLVLYYFEGRSKRGLSPTQLSLIIAIGIGFQNLTEGLVFGSLGVTFGLSGAALVVLVGFIFQNVTEGFPIASPFLGRLEGKTMVMVMMFLIGGITPVIGGTIGYFYNSIIFDMIFDGIAIGSILYVILPMFKMLFRESEAPRQRVAYFGVFLGFVVGFLVNLI